MRYGFTTGSCAAAAAKAAAYMLLIGQEKTEITIETPKGILYRTKVLDITCKEKEVSCAIEKDAGDDPDITGHTWIYAKVSYGEEKGQKIIIDGGKGVGRVTRPGLDQPIGSAAINHVPREMIKKEVMEVCQLADYKGSLNIEISVPEGEKLSKQTFNPKLGIIGGISILGTSGMVEPMSNRAILDTIKIELKQRKAEGFDYAAISPGNYGLDFMKKRGLKCSNFIGETIDMAVELEFHHILLTGHIGKLIKVAGGIMNTHSKEADCRMELLAAFSIKNKIEYEKVLKVLECATTQEAVSVLKESGKLSSIMKDIAERICYYMEYRAKGKIRADCVIYANEFGELARSKGAEHWFTLLEQEQVQ